MPSAPEKFLCPLTMQVMKVPVRNPATGRTYEQGAILNWLFTGKATCPFTRQPLSPSDLVVHESLQAEIQQWKLDNASNSSLDVSFDLDQSCMSNCNDDDEHGLWGHHPSLQRFMNDLVEQNTGRHVSDDALENDTLERLLNRVKQLQEKRRENTQQRRPQPPQPPKPSPSPPKSSSSKQRKSILKRVFQLRTSECP